MRNHLRHLVIAVAWRPVLMRGIVMYLMRARRKMGLLWRIARADRGHYAQLAISNCTFK